MTKTEASERIPLAMSSVSSSHQSIKINKVRDSGEIWLLSCCMYTQLRQKPCHTLHVKVV